MFSPGGRALLAAALTLLATAASAAAATPVPEVRGPLPVTQESHPFGGAQWQLRAQDLQENGYVEEEYILSGKANVYEWGADNKAVVRTPDVPYGTRVLVRRPIDPRRMSGTVIVEPLNPSNLFDLNIGWALSGDQFMRNGDVWVGFTSKPIAIKALKTFDAAALRGAVLGEPARARRPAQLHEHPDDRRPAGGALARDRGRAGVGRHQPGRRRALRSDAASNPAAALSPGRSRLRLRLLADRLDVDHLHQRDRAARGRGRRRRRSSTATSSASRAARSSAPRRSTSARRCPPIGDPRRSIRERGRAGHPDDVAVGLPDRHRLARAGLQHAARPLPPLRDGGRRARDAGRALLLGPAEDITAAGRDVPPMSCNEGPRSRFPSRIFVDAALQNIDRWSRDGVPRAARPGHPGGERAAGAGRSSVTSAAGCARRILDVPTSTWFASRPARRSAGIAGYEVPFNQAQLDALYPSRARTSARSAQDVRRAGRRALPDGVRRAAAAARRGADGHPDAGRHAPDPLEQRLELLELGGWEGR